MVKKIAMLDKNTLQELKTFNSALEATNYLIENNLTNNKAANSRILKICKGIDKSAYGFCWKYI